MLLHGNSPRLAHSVQSTALRVFALLLACWGSVQLAQAQSSAVVQHGNGSKIFLKIDAHLLRSNLDTLFTKAADLQNQINTLSWADVLTNGTSPGVDVDFFGYSALGLGQVTTTGTVTADSLVLNKDASVAGRLVVSDVVSFGDSLLVAGTVVLGDSLRVVDAVSFGSRLHVTGVTAFGDSVHVVGNVDLDGLFNVDGAATFKSTLEVDGETTLNDTLHVAAPALLGDSLHVVGGAALSGTLSVAGNASVGGTLAASGATSLASTLAVTGLVTLSDSLHVDDNADVDGNFNVDGTTTLNGTTVDGALDVNGNADVSGTFDAGGAAALAGTLAVTGETTLHDTLHVAAPALLGDSLHVAGGAALAGTLDVAGASTLSGTQVNGTLDVNGPADVSGATALAGTLAVTGVATFADTLEVQGPGLFADSLDVAGKARFASVVYADSIVSGKVLNAQVRDLANHTTDGLVETATNRYFTPAREQVLQAQLDSLEDRMAELLDLLYNSPSVTTTAASSVLVTTASLNATYVDGGASPSDIGFIISISPVFADSTIHVVSASGGALLKALTGLTKGTTYYYKAYIETIMGSATGSVQQFTTITDAQATTDAVNDAAMSTATLRGQVASTGGGTVSATGFVYGTNANLSGATNAPNATLSGAFTEALTGLGRNTTYYYSA
jgi:cytoskeletal protein CcmA (bactofilin family)